MEVRNQTFEVKLQRCQTFDALSGVFQTVMMLRCTGKYEFYAGSDNKYRVSSIGYRDVKCDFVDLHYVCCNSPSLINAVNAELLKFSEALQESESYGCNTASIALEFYKRNPNKWSLYSECIPWETWNVKLDLTMDRWEDYRDSVGAVISDKIVHITDIVNRYENYVPVISHRGELDNIFNTSFPDVQPYLFKFIYSVNGKSSNFSMGSTVRRLLGETFYT